MKQPSVDMALNGSGVRDIVRVLRVSSTTVLNVLKKKESAIKQANERLLHTLDPRQVNVFLRKIICFSRSLLMHDLVVGLFIMRYEFGYAV